MGIINQSLASNDRLGEGSGVVVSEDGLVLTVGHVVAKPGNELIVIFPDGRRAAAKALGANFSRDSGLAKITDPGKWPYVEMGRSDDIKPGAWCMALGHPGGIQQGRTPPIRLGRVLNSGKGARFLVTDATVISGDSGGPLFDLEGRVIGVHSNIGMNVNQNQHVPINVYREQWDDLLAGKAIGSPADLGRSNRTNAAKLNKFRELLFQRLMAGNPEAQDLVKDGRLDLAPDEIDRLIAKWEKSPPAGSAAKAPPASGPPAGTAAGKPLDFLKFQRLFQERLLAGDPEVLRLVKEGTMMVTPEQMHQLLDQWEKKAPAADSSRPKSPEKPAAGAVPGSNRAESPKAAPGQTAGGDKQKADRGKADNAKADPSAKPPMSPETVRNLQDMLAALLGRGRAAVEDHGKSSPALLRDIAPVAAQAARSTVVVLCDGKPAVLGTVVRKDGYIVTKASELHGKLACRIGARDLPATTVKSKTEDDLALLKVDADDLVPIAWADGDPPVPGSWLITPAPGEDVVGLGIVSVAARAIPDAPKILLRNRAVVGVTLDQTVGDARLREIAPDLPAAKAGLKVGDVILKIDGQPTANSKDMYQVLGKYQPGDKITIELLRNSKPMKVQVELASSDAMAPKVSADQLTRLSQAGGTVSKRHNNFASALTHDTVLQAAECGGPVVDLDGRTIGLNIARADRTATYAIPAGAVRKVVDELLAGVK